MNFSLYTRNEALATNPRLVRLEGELRRQGHIVEPYSPSTGLPKGTDMLLSVGGDGTFLSSALVVKDSGVPVLGVNLGRLGFLSENDPESIALAIARRAFRIEQRSLLSIKEIEPSVWPYALNEITVHRSAAAMLGVNVSIDGTPLPTYWADGLVVATSSGSTAYSLSVGGPIVLPDSKVLIVSPIAPHNLNVRPLVVPYRSEIALSFVSRDEKVILTMDNRNFLIPASSHLSVSLAQFSLNRVRLDGSDFIKALTTKLFWGEDIRNGNEK